jgi:hypothetical protein
MSRREMTNIRIRITNVRETFQKWNPVAQFHVRCNTSYRLLWILLTCFCREEGGGCLHPCLAELIKALCLPAGLFSTLKKIGDIWIAKLHL